MRVLVLLELPDLNVPPPVVFITDYEPGIMQVLQQSVYVAVVVGQRLGLDALRPIVESAFAVCDAPQRGEQQPAERRDLGKLVVGEERGLEVTRSRHSAPPARTRLPAPSRSATPSNSLPLSLHPSGSRWSSP